MTYTPPTWSASGKRDVTYDDMNDLAAAVVSASSGVSSMTVNVGGHLIATLADGSTVDAGAIPMSDDGVSALVSSDSSSTYTAVEGVVDAHLGGDATGLVTDVAGITPRSDVRAVGQDEQVVNATDHGADPTGSTSSVAAINALLASGASHVLIANGTFLVDGALSISASYQHLTIDASATLLVSNGYAGDVIRISSATGETIRGVRIDGAGVIVEASTSGTPKGGGASTAAGAWTGVRFSATGYGVQGSTVRDLQIKWPGVGVAWDASGGGCVNGCTVDSLGIYYAVSFFETTGTSFSGNTISSILGQTGHYTEYGVKSLSGSLWNLLNVCIWDMSNAAAAVSCQINSDAVGITIIGGFLTIQNFQNNAADGQVTIIDNGTNRPWHGPHDIHGAEFLPDASATTPAIHVIYKSWPLLSVPETGASFIASAFWEVPEPLSYVTAEVACVGTTANTGDVAVKVLIQEQIGGSQWSQMTHTTITQDTVTTSGESGTMSVTGGTRVRVALYRYSDDATDTLTGSFGIVSVTLRCYRS